MSIRRRTVLCSVDALPEPDVPTPRVVGVDEYTTHKGRHCGTVLVDIETRRPADLLPEREAPTLGVWLAQPPGVEVVCCDRAPFFTEGAAAGAPQAVQVSGTHLWHNLSEAAERTIAQHRRCLRVLIGSSSWWPTTPPYRRRAPTSAWPASYRRTRPVQFPSRLLRNRVPQSSPDRARRPTRRGRTRSTRSLSCRRSRRPC
ncbi:transposase [Streptomyces sp. NPDC057253]|uniref:transposase n=1 Tax=Streptomyces sp. NPDC057253 TaxID=3346069 RepID=UPI0036438711